jgi:RimJ/RimL family protein N-acetyltransferase
MIVTDDRVAAFVAGACGVDFIPPWTCMGIEKDGEIIAGVVLNVFEGADVHMSAAGSGWTRGFLADFGNYVFDQLQCERVTAITEQPKVVRLAERLGGEVEGLMRNHFGKGRDAFVIGILKEDWKF